MDSQTGRARSYTTNQPYHPTGPYASQPVLLEPACIDDSSGHLVVRCKLFQTPSQSYGNPEFLSAISATGLPAVNNKNTRSHWTYEDRRVVQQACLPFFYLGPHIVARDEAWLKEKQITMVIGVRSAQAAARSPKLFDPARFPACKDLLTATFDVDSPYDVITRIKPVLKLMTDHLESQTGGRPVSSHEDVGGKILVFCESGNERSPVLIAAWMMVVFGITWSESLNLIQAVRFSIAPDSDTNDMLRTFQGMIKAEADTAIAHQNALNGTQPLPSRAQKRSIDEAYDSDDTMTNDADEAERPGIAPFLDRASQRMPDTHSMEG